MNITCKDRDRIFRDGNAEEWAALELHATACAECAEELRAWKALSRAAEELRDYQQDSGLWVKIEAALEQQTNRRTRVQRLWEWLAVWRALPVGWQAGLAGALALLLAVSGTYVLVHRGVTDPGANKLLRSAALAEVERTQRDYMKAIAKLATEAKPQLESPASPLMASYREKLMVLDSAIEELRQETERNPSNAHLRYQLLAMYQEKQETLQEVLETKR